MSKKDLFFKERRGRKKVSDPIEPVIIYVHNSIIVDDNGNVLDNKSEAYKIKLDEIKRRLTVHVYSGLPASNPLAMSK